MNASKKPLRGNGEAIVVTPTSSGTAETVYTAAAANTGWDELWLYAANKTDAEKFLFYDVGGTTNFARTRLAPSPSMMLILPGVILKGGVSVKVYASAASDIVLMGWVIQVREDA